MNTDFARQQMVEQQVRAWDVLDADNTEIPIGHGQTMMTPTVEGRVLQALEPGSAASVLEIGTGSGFLAACFARLANKVTSVDIHQDFLKSAAVNLDDSGINNVELLEMDATQQLPEEQFDAIAVTGSIQKFDPRFVKALKPEGRLFVVVGEAPVMEALLIRRTSESEWQTTTLFETRLRPLVNGSMPPQFLF